MRPLDFGFRISFWFLFSGFWSRSSRSHPVRVDPVIAELGRPVDEEDEGAADAAAVIAPIAADVAHQHRLRLGVVGGGRRAGRARIDGDAGAVARAELLRVVIDRLLRLADGIA